MKFGTKVFVIASEKIIEATIRDTISCKGIVTGYEVDSKEFPSAPSATKANKKDVFVDEEKAKKALFLKKLKKTGENLEPSEDMKGNRRWIAGFKRRGYGQ